MSTVTDRDIEYFKQIKSIIEDPRVVPMMEEAELASRVDFCMGRLNRVRKGGRSKPLIALSVILWRARIKWPPRATSLEAVLATALRVALDPTFIQPEWGIVLAAGVLARHMDSFRNEIRDEIHREAIAIIGHLAVSQDATHSVRLVARKTLDEDATGYQEGLTPLVKTAMGSWPTTEGIMDLTPEHVDELVAAMDKEIPANLTEHDLRVYRLKLEREGTWEILESIS